MVAILLPIRGVLGSNLGRKVVYPDRFFFFAVLPHGGTISQRTSAHFHILRCSHSPIIAPFDDWLLIGLLYT
jgi:hypothetical protein